MSAAHRSLIRLPLDVFTDLILDRAHNVADNPEVLRRGICSKLKKFPTKSRANGDVVYESVTTVGQLLTRMSKLTLLKVLDPLLTYEECDLFLRRVATTCAPKAESAFDLLKETDSIADLTSETSLEGHQNNPQQFAREHPLNRMRYLPSGLASLDHCLRGGLRIGTITEVVGRAGAGKTQLAMQLCVLAARYRQGCIYIDTEKKLSLPRLQEIAETRATEESRNYGTGHTGGSQQRQFSYDMPPYLSAASTTNNNHHGWQTSQQHCSQSSPDIAYRHPKQVLDNVTVLSPTTMQELLSALVEVEELILVRNQDAVDAAMANNQQGHYNFAAAMHHSAQQSGNNQFPIRLLIVDSIAAPTKRGTGCGSAAERSTVLFQCAQRLKQLANQLQLAVLVVNQVFLEQRSNSRSATNHPDEVFVKAALGNSWHHCVSTRIMLEQAPSENGLRQSPPQQHQNPNATRKPTRTARIIKSNLAALQSTNYEVVGAGVVDAWDP